MVESNKKVIKKRGKFQTNCVFEIIKTEEIIYSTKINHKNGPQLNCNLLRDKQVQQRGVNNNNTATNLHSCTASREFHLLHSCRKIVEHLRVRCWSKARLLFGSNKFTNLKSHILARNIREGTKGRVVALLCSTCKLRNGLIVRKHQLIHT